MDDLTAVVPAGGRGTRLSSVTGSRPKSLALVGDVPFLSLQLRHLLELGISRVHLCLGVGAEEILEVVSGVTPDGLDVTFTTEHEPLGVIGAVRRALPTLPSRFVMTYGDVLAPPAVDELWAAHEGNAGLATLLVAAATSESNLELDDEDVVVRYEKGASRNTYTDIGLWILDAPAVAACPSNAFLAEADLLARLIPDRAACALRWPEPSLHIGDPSHLRELERSLAGRGQRRVASRDAFQKSRTSSE